MRRALLAAAAALLCFAPAGAHAQAPNIVGTWAFETDIHPESGCILRGEALVRAGARAGEFDVSLRATEQCPDGGIWRAEEACQGRRSDRALQIICTLIRAEPDNYIPDHFNLTIESGSSMSGRLIDFGAWNEPVRWRRASGALVS
jgi:hypothetical protein